MEIFILKPLVIGKLSLFSGMENDALMHREGLKCSCQFEKWQIQPINTKVAGEFALIFD